MPMGTRRIKLSQSYMAFLNENDKEYLSMQVESNGDYGESVEIDLLRRQVDAILTVLKAIPNQPITINIEDGQIGIDRMVF